MKSIPKLCRLVSKKALVFAANKNVDRNRISRVTLITLNQSFVAMLIFEIDFLVSSGWYSSLWKSLISWRPFKYCKYVDSSVLSIFIVLLQLSLWWLPSIRVSWKRRAVILLLILCWLSFCWILGRNRNFAEHGRFCWIIHWWHSQRTLGHCTESHTVTKTSRQKTHRSLWTSKNSVAFKLNLAY